MEPKNPKVGRVFRKSQGQAQKLLCLQFFKEKFHRKEEADLRKNRRKTGEGRIGEGQQATEGQEEEEGGENEREGGGKRRAYLFLEV